MVLSTSLLTPPSWPLVISHLQMFGAAGTGPVNSAMVWEGLPCLESIWIPSGLLSWPVPDKISGCKSMASLPSQASAYSLG